MLPVMARSELPRATPLKVDIHAVAWTRLRWKCDNATQEHVTSCEIPRVQVRVRGGAAYHSTSQGWHRDLTEPIFQAHVLWICEPDWKLLAE